MTAGPGSSGTAGAATSADRAVVDTEMRMSEQTDRTTSRPKHEAGHAHPAAVRQALQLDGSMDAAEFRAAMRHGVASDGEARATEIGDESLLSGHWLKNGCRLSVVGYRLIE